MKEPLISVIVPVYKVEKYLNRCVESIVGQTYSNLEIILVDDGSPDHCPEICDKWENLDSRITVIHQSNCGGGQARNRALDIARGDFVAFVDSDDYIAPTMYEFLHDLFRDDIDIVECGFHTVYDDNVEFDNITAPFEMKKFTAEEAVMENIRDRIFRQLIWNKLYRKSTIDDVRFPTGSKIDDEFWTYRVLANARKLVYTNKRLYAYRQQENSVMHLLSTEKRIQVLEAKKQRYEYICTKMPKLEADSLYDIWLTCLYQGQMILRTDGKEKCYVIWDMLEETIRKYPLKKVPSYVSWTQKIWLKLTSISFSMTCRIRNALKIGL